MKFFLDSSDINEVEYAFENFGIEGVTTNPRQLAVIGKKESEVVKELAEWATRHGFAGSEEFPISIEVDPNLERWEDIYREAKLIVQQGPWFIIKIPCTEQGLIAARKLEKEGIRTNVTLVFSRSQAIAVGRLGAKFVSPFVGWKENYGEDTFDYLNDIVQIYKNYDYRTEIIVAAVRSGKVIADAARMGADIVTCALETMKNSVYHPFTDYGVRFFTDAWNSVEGR